MKKQIRNQLRDYLGGRIYNKLGTQLEMQPKSLLNRGIWGPLRRHHYKRIAWVLRKRLEVS